jgi:hypothetical protein
MRDHPVAAGEHLPRHLRVAALIRIVKTAKTETHQPADDQ